MVRATVSTLQYVLRSTDKYCTILRAVCKVANIACQGPLELFDAMQEGNEVEMVQTLQASSSHINSLSYAFLP